MLWYMKLSFECSRIFFGLTTHYDDVIMTMLASQITSLTVVYSIVYSGVDQSKHQSSASLAFVQEIHRGPVNFPHKWPVTRKMFPFDDVIMNKRIYFLIRYNNQILSYFNHFYFSTSVVHQGPIPLRNTHRASHIRPSDIKRASKSEIMFEQQ